MSAVLSAEKGKTSVTGQDNLALFAGKFVWFQDRLQYVSNPYELEGKKLVTIFGASHSTSSSDFVPGCDLESKYWPNGKLRLISSMRLPTHEELRAAAYSTEKHESWNPCLINPGYFGAFNGWAEVGTALLKQAGPSANATPTKTPAPAVGEPVITRS